MAGETSKNEESTLMNLQIQNTEDLVYGYAPQPVKCGRNIIIGQGVIYPEINFTLPQLQWNKVDQKELLTQYDEITNELCQRAVDLESEGLIIEFELLPPMTLNPQLGADITAVIRSKMDSYYNKYALAGALRVTPVDIRDITRPPALRSGEYTQKMFTSFEKCSAAGADLISIESTGGKEIHDDALLIRDLQAIIFSLGVLGVRDMEFLWTRITEIAKKHNVIAAGDTACGFANTAMILADKGMIPKVLATIVRAASIPRSLVAYQKGAVGPSKDCAYEGPFLKAIAGIPISMEGKTSACAHLSKLGNISAAYADLWSNESIQNIRLLSTFAPTVSLEQLIYDCRLHNTATKQGRDSAIQLRNWLIESDAEKDPQAFIFKPENVLRIAQRIVEQNDSLDMTISAVDETISILENAIRSGQIKLPDTEKRWLAMLHSQLDIISRNVNELTDIMNSGEYKNKFKLSEYGFN